MINGGSDFLLPNKLLRILSVLVEISNSPNISQHQLARKVKLSSSQVNNYVKELRAKGMVDVKGNTNRTIRYFLTRKGQREKALLLISYSTDVIQLYARVKREFKRRLQEISCNGFRRAVLFGAAETGEVVLAAIKETALRVVGISDNDPAKHGKRFGDFTIIPPSQIESLKPDGIIITSFGKIDEIKESLEFLRKKGILIRSLTGM